MKKLVIVFFVFLIIGIFIVSSVEEIETKASQQVYDKLDDNKEVRVVVKVSDRASNNEKKIEDIKKDIEEGINSDIKQDLGNIVAVEVSKKDLAELEKNIDIESIVIDKPIKVFLQDSIDLINSSSVWPLQVNGINLTGIDETVCILDTGIDFTHPDLIGKNKTCIISCVTENCVANCSIGDDNGHGTHVAGIVAASNGILGVGRNISLIGVKVLNSAGTGSGTDLDAGIDWCIANRDTYNISVISMSLGTDCILTPEYCYDYYCDGEATETSTVLRINNATFYNISVIAATGNDGNYTHISSPACIENSTAVGWSTKDDAISSNGNRNNLTDLVAPGSNINSTQQGGSYLVQSGTSMAAPHVAGAFALIRQVYRLQGDNIPTPSEIKSLLNLTGKQINDVGGNGLNYSRIDIYSAIDSIIKVPRISSISPDNNHYANSINQNQTFICNSTSNYELTNITFYLWNSSSNLLNSSTLSVTGLINSSIFYYNFTIEDSYEWNCIIYNNQSFSNENANYTISYDATNPIISNVSDSVATTTNTITWNTNENANSSIDYGTTASLGSNSGSLELVTDHSISLSSLSSSTAYYYNITSCDEAGNCIVNGTNSFTTSAPDTSSGSSGGGGRSVIMSKTYEPAEAEITLGYTEKLSKNDKIKFEFFDEKTESHTLTVTEIKSNYVIIIIKSNPINLQLGIGQSSKLNLTNSNYYDLYVKLNSITGNKADITIQTIKEQIPKPAITGDASKSEEVNEKQEEKPKPEKKYILIIKDALLVTLIIAVVIILISKSFTEKKLKKREKKIKEYKENFKKMKSGK